MRHGRHRVTTRQAGKAVALTLTVAQYPEYHGIRYTCVLEYVALALTLAFALALAVGEWLLASDLALILTLELEFQASALVGR